MNLRKFTRNWIAFISMQLLIFILLGGALTVFQAAVSIVVFTLTALPPAALLMANKKIVTWRVVEIDVKRLSCTQAREVNHV